MYCRRDRAHTSTGNSSSESFSFMYPPSVDLLCPLMRQKQLVTDPNPVGRTSCLRRALMRVLFPLLVRPKKTTFISLRSTTSLALAILVLTAASNSDSSLCAMLARAVAVETLASSWVTALWSESFANLNSSAGYNIKEKRGKEGSFKLVLQ